MIKNQYLQNITKKLDQFAQGKSVKMFIFGSSLKKAHFGDVDIGIMGTVTKKQIRQLHESFEDSTFPYIVDIVSFNTVSPTFKNNVLKNKILWIKR